MEKGEGLEFRAEPSHAELCRVPPPTPLSQYKLHETKAHIIVALTSGLSSESSHWYNDKQIVKCFMYRFYN